MIVKKKHNKYHIIMFHRNHLIKAIQLKFDQSIIVITFYNTVIDYANKDVTYE